MTAIPAATTTTTHTTNTRQALSSCRTRADRPALTPDLGDAERDYVFAVAMKYVKDEDAAADVTQDALLRAHRHRASFRGDSRYSTWLYRVAATSALMYLRSQRRRSRECLVCGREDGEVRMPEDPNAPARTPEDALASAEAMEVVRERLGDLGEKYQQIFWMRYLEGYTETEIAAQLRLNLATVKTRAHRARVAVRDTLRAQR